jgi:hypothetical protein
VTEALTVSVAVMVWLPVVNSVAEKVLVPFASVVSDGSNASRPASGVLAVGKSEFVRCTVPTYVVTVLFEASRAVTVTLNAVPTVALGGTVSEK